MKQHFTGSIIFILSFSIGLTNVWLFTIQNQPINVSPHPPTGLSILEPTQFYTIETNEEQRTNLNNHEDADVETFTDVKRIGRSRRNKIELRCFNQGDKRVARITFYSRDRNDRWKQKQSFEFSKDGLLSCDPRIEDFNNYRLKDFTYQSGEAARGANEVRKLFIYDKKRDELVYIKNSDDYPNMVYNKRRDCIDAWLFYGATSTVFLKIEGDRLREIAMVSTGTERVVEIFDDAGKSHVISRRKMNEQDIYTRYLDFNPVVPYGE